MNRFFSIVVILGLLAGCSQKPADQNGVKVNQAAVAVLQSSSQVTSAPTPEPTFQPFVVYGDKASKQNHYIPSGFMPDGKCLTFNDAWTESCQAGSTCIKIEYDVACSRDGQKWAGIYWLNPANNWGKQKGGFDLNGATKLTFWAKGEKGGERIEEIKMGGLTGDYPDSDMAMIGPVILTNEWKQYTIDLRGKDLTYIAGGFAWSTNVEVNPENCTFYLDQVQYE